MKGLTIIISISFVLVLGIAPLKEDGIENFLNLRYGGDTTKLDSILSDEFIFEHIPYTGLGLFTHFVDGSLIITKTIRDTLDTTLMVGDRIFEVNGNIVDSSGLNVLGPIGEIQNLIIIKKNDSVFKEISLPISEFQFLENGESFLRSIKAYSNVWYDYDITINDIIIKKNKAVVSYRWEGSKKDSGYVYMFNAIEILTLNKKKDKVSKIQSLWSEKQLRDQFK